MGCLEDVSGTGEVKFEGACAGWAVVERWGWMRYTYKQSKILLHQTIPVALGTDGVCSNNSADLFETMKTTALVQKMLNNDPCLLPARQVLEMATQAGLASQAVPERSECSAAAWTQT